MKLFAWALSLALFITMMVEAVAFHKATVCRQEAWKESLVIKTRSLLEGATPFERGYLLDCRTHIVRSHDDIYWQRLPTLKRHQFLLRLQGLL